MNSRIRTPFYIFFLNSDHVAARSLRSLHSNKGWFSITTLPCHFEGVLISYLAISVWRNVTTHVMTSATGAHNIWQKYMHTKLRYSSLFESLKTNWLQMRIQSTRLQRCIGKPNAARVVTQLYLINQIQSTNVQARIQGRWNGWIFTPSPPPFFLSPLLSFFSYLSNIEIIFDFSDII